MSAFILAVLFVPLAAYPQEDKKYIREGNREYEKENYADSEIAYRKDWIKTMPPEMQFLTSVMPSINRRSMKMQANSSAIIMR